MLPTTHVPFGCGSIRVASAWLDRMPPERRYSGSGVEWEAFWESPDVERDTLLLGTGLVWVQSFKGKEQQG